MAVTITMQSIINSITIVSTEPKPLAISSSNPSTLAFAIPNITAAPALSSNDPEVSTELTISAGEWNSTLALVYSYQWFKDGLEIVSETASAYMPIPQDEGSILSCEVTAKNSEGSSSTLIAADNAVTSAIALTYMVFTVKTDNTGTSNDDQFTLPFFTHYAIDLEIDWGDGTTTTLAAGGYSYSAPTHTYADGAGTYEIKLMGPTNAGFRFNNGGDKLKILEISQWGTATIESMYQAFFGCLNLEITATDAPNLSILASTGLFQTFTNCKSLTNIGGLWDVSAITTMQQMFDNCDVFNDAGIINWDVSSVDDFYRTFYDCSIFNQDIGGWNTSAVERMRDMFYQCQQFDQDIGGWNTSNVNDMRFMFFNNLAFSHSLAAWDVSKVTNMDAMFFNNDNFTADLSGWTTSALASAAQMFRRAHQMNFDLSQWDWSELTTGFYMLESANALSQTNYEALLVSLEAQNSNSNVPFHGGDATYAAGSAGAIARAALISDHSWTFTDGGQI